MCRFTSVGHHWRRICAGKENCAGREDDGLFVFCGEWAPGVGHDAKSRRQARSVLLDANVGAQGSCTPQSAPSRRADLARLPDNQLKCAKATNQGLVLPQVLHPGPYSLQYIQACLCTSSPTCMWSPSKREKGVNEKAWVLELAHNLHVCEKEG